MQYPSDDFDSLPVTIMNGMSKTLYYAQMFEALGRPESARKCREYLANLYGQRETILAGDLEKYCSLVIESRKYKIF